MNKQRGGRRKGKGHVPPNTAAAPDLTPLEFPPLPTHNKQSGEQLVPGMGGFVDRSRRGGGRTLVLPDSNVDLSEEFDFGAANSQFDKDAILENVRELEETGEIKYIVDDNTGRSIGMVGQDGVGYGYRNSAPKAAKTRKPAKNKGKPKVKDVVPEPEPSPSPELQLSLLSGFHLETLNNTQLYRLENLAMLALGRIRRERAVRGTPMLSPMMVPASPQ